MGVQDNTVVATTSQTEVGGLKVTGSFGETQPVDNITVFVRCVEKLDHTGVDVLSWLPRFVERRSEVEESVGRSWLADEVGISICVRLSDGVVSAGLNILLVGICVPAQPAGISISGKNFDAASVASWVVQWPLTVKSQYEWQET